VTCQKIADFLMDYLNRELSEAQRAIFEEHLEICPACVDYLQSYEMTVKLSKSVCRPIENTENVKVPEDLIHAILAARTHSA